LCIESQEDESLLQIKLFVGAWQDLLLEVQGMHLGDKRGDKSPSPQSGQTSPQEMLWESQAEKWDTEAVYRKQCFIVPAQTQWTCVQRLSPENEEILPYIPLQAGYKSKKQDLIQIWLYTIL
jgi:hypothetical protein